MVYQIKLITPTYVLDQRDISTDEELLAFIGRYSLWFFLALDSIDYKDAEMTCYGEKDASDQLLAFTAHKLTDSPDGPHRHGSPQNELARGHCWYLGKKVQCKILVFKK